MSKESREKVATALSNTDRQRLLAWIFQHSLTASPRGAHWGERRTSEDVLRLLPELNWRRMKRLSDRTIYRASLEKIYTGIVQLRDLPRKTKLWIEVLPDTGHEVRIPGNGEVLRVQLGGKAGCRALIFPSSSLSSREILQREKEVTIELSKAADGSEVVCAVYPGTVNVAQCAADVCCAAGEISVRDAKKAGIQVALFALPTLQF